MRGNYAERENKTDKEKRHSLEKAVMEMPYLLHQKQQWRFVMGGIAVLAVTFCCHAAIDDPFPCGYSMGNFGAILWPRGISGRQPWTPSASLAYSKGFGFSVAGVDYYDDMDNLSGQNIRQACAGGWLAAKKVTVKAAYVHFAAFGLYMEQKGSLSVGTTAIPFISAGMEISGYRAGLIKERDERQTIATIGASLLCSRKYASISLSVCDITVKQAGVKGLTPPFTVKTGIHTMPHKFGAQGVSLSIEPGDQLQIRFYAAEEYWIGNTIGLGAALSVNPVMAGFSCTVAIKRASVFCSLVHHPVLGWSKGAGGEWSKDFCSKSDSVGN
jgi:hypothetical protein